MKKISTQNKSKLALLAFLLLYNTILSAQINLPGIPVELTVQSIHMSGDGNVMFYYGKTSNEISLLYYLEKQGSEWSSAKEISLGNSFARIDGIHSNYTGDKLFIATNLSASIGGMDIFWLEHKEGRWGEVNHFPSPINSAADEGNPNLSNDESFIIFTRVDEKNKLKNAVCKKIYISYQEENGVWSEPILLPRWINNECEDAPVLAYDDKTLFFSSYRERVVGDRVQDYKELGCDIYSSKMVVKDFWSKPENILEFSTYTNDMYPSFSAKNDLVYFISGKEYKRGGAAGVYQKNYDIPLEPMVYVNGEIKELETENKLNAEISVLDPLSKKKIKQNTIITDSGKYQMLIPPGKKYLFKVNKDSFAYRFKEIDLLDINEFESRELNFDLLRNIRVYVNVYDHDLVKPLSSEIIVGDLSAETPVNGIIDTLEIGKYTLNMPIGAKYELVLNSDNYISDTLNLNFQESVKFTDFEYDIYLKPEKVDFNLVISDAILNENIDTEIEFQNAETKEEINLTDTIISDSEDTTIKRMGKGEYILKLRNNSLYDFTIKPPKGYWYGTDEREINTGNGEHTLKIELNRLDSLRVIPKHVIFEKEAAGLKKESHNVLKDIVYLLRKNPLLRFHLVERRNFIDSLDNSYRLSDKRVRSVAKFIGSYGINKDRFVLENHSSIDSTQYYEVQDSLLLQKWIEFKVLKNEIIHEELDSNKVSNTNEEEKL